MKHPTRLGIGLSLGLFSALLGCSGSVTSDDSGGSNASGGNAGSSAAAGSGAAGSGTGGSGTAGAGGGCTNGATMTSGCNSCQCRDGQWACTNIACTTLCGGFAGNTCSANEYCAYMPDQMCGAADASAFCMPRPDACPDIYMPVCGCDLNNYSSVCDAAAHGQGVSRLAPCPLAGP